MRMIINKVREEHEMKLMRIGFTFDTYPEPSMERIDHQRGVFSPKQMCTQPY